MLLAFLDYKLDQLLARFVRLVVCIMRTILKAVQTLASVSFQVFVSGFSADIELVAEFRHGPSEAPPIFRTPSGGLLV